MTSITATISELKKDPMGTIAAGGGLPVAILDQHGTAFYCVPVKTYEALMEKLEDVELNAIADARQNGPLIKMALDQL